MSDGQDADRARFTSDGLLRLMLPESRTAADFLRTQRDRLEEAIGTPRPWHYTELHNPWSRSASWYDSWGFLDLCSAPAVTDAVAIALGPDVILYDSQWLPDPWYGSSKQTHDWTSEMHRVPVEPPAGVTALLSIEHWRERGMRLEYLPGSHCDAHFGAEPHAFVPEPAELILIDANLRYRIAGSADALEPVGYVVRYFPATSRYLRRADLPVHRRLGELYPFLNYAQMPLWLVRGIDHAANDFV